ncbi:MAG: Uma2 family endonuclease [Desulforhabdus sp.]|jgi:Uma2 family endonuclease|nr:Uma2 family endonuclease [Desulforhabdus sp.]
MPETATRKAAYEELLSIPENTTGEIINGELVVTPRPSRTHIYTTSALDKKIGSPYQFGEGGPGGWIILVEPEVGLGEHILVPDLAGWREDRYPDEEPHNWISVAPDWICEILSPGTRRRDRMEKMPIYAQFGVSFLWLIDPIDKTLEVFRLKEGEWTVAGLHAGEAKVRAVPFIEIEISLSDLWR